jgi:iron complex transport system ATP-binding protein
MTGLTVADLSVRYGAVTVVDEISFDVPRGSLTVMVGPNGSGKTSCLRGILGLADSSGRATWDGGDLTAMDPAERARRASYVAQTRDWSLGPSVRSVVGLGRLAYGDPWRDTAEDREAVAAALATCGLDDLADRRASDLSGGESQRVSIARGLAQAAPLMILDEPTTHLDPRHAGEIASLLRRLVGEGLTVLVTAHDLAWASSVADQVVVMKAGKICGAGGPELLRDPAVLSAVYGVGFALYQSGSSTIALPSAIKTPDAPSIRD